ncbi:hypothetical protein FOL47_009052 [Perkinsus chesapeaki]|uniref:E3 ubiquitin-protein ligase CHFR n=1 Tax=Perkinsus chesapeaki TaxID=330153 RepID=A0A7J6MT73_PERCH|nr:hypothetical protein FOL47_009052 [Perkinsus chesapeaki]
MAAATAAIIHTDNEQCSDGCVAHLVKMGNMRASEVDATRTPTVVHLRAALDGSAKVIVGRVSDQCDVVLASDVRKGMLSRRHACLQRRNNSGEWVIKELRTVNGVLVDGNILEPDVEYPLNDGDIITFGKKLVCREFEYQFRVGPLVLQEAASRSLPEIVDCDESVDRDRPSTADSTATSRKRTRSPRSRSARAKKAKRSSVDSDEEDDNHSEELQKQLDAIRQENEQLKEQLRSVTASPSTPGKEGSVVSVRNQQTPAEKAKGRLYADLECIICRDLMVSPATLECSHSFCFKCIEEWLTAGNFRCPVCRADITRSPTKTLQLQQVVTTAIETHGDDAEQADYADRLDEHKKWDERRQILRAQLMGSIETASENGLQFFEIGLKWNSDDKTRFHEGIRRYHSDAREVYCASIGLTKSWIQQATRGELEMAMENLRIGVSSDDYPGDIPKPTDLIRRRLLLFTRYC